MNKLKQFFAKRWKQVAGVGAAYLALEVGAVIFVTVWGVGKVIG